MCMLSIVQIEVRLLLVSFKFDMPAQTFLPLSSDKVLKMFWWAIGMNNYFVRRHYNIHCLRLSKQIECGMQHGYELNQINSA